MYFYRPFETQSGHPWIAVRHRDSKKETPVPANLFVGDGKQATAWLGENGVAIAGTLNARGLLSQTGSQRETEPNAPLDQVGWNGKIFVMPSLKVMHAEGEAPNVVLHRQLSSAIPKGTLKRWKKAVATPNSQHPLAVFAICTAFVGPLLDLVNDTPNIGFGLVDDGTGIARQLLKLAASAVGDPVGSERGGYELDARDLMRDPDAHISARSDGLVVIHGIDAMMAGEPQVRRTASVKSLFDHVSKGRASAWPGQTRGIERKLAFLMSTSRPITELAGVEDALLTAVNDRFCSIPTNSEHYVADGVPPATTAIAVALNAAADQHGTAFQRYVSGLVEARQLDEAKLRATIQSRLADFVDWCGPPAQDDHVRKAFGLVAVAGALAKSYGALPQSYRYCASALACYAAYRKVRGEVPAPFADRLRAIAAASSTLGVADFNRKHDVAAARVMKKMVKGRQRLFIRAAHIHAVFPDWDILQRDPSVVAMLKRDGKHMKTWTVLHPKLGKERVYAFIVPLEPVADDLTDDG